MRGQSSAVRGRWNGDERGGKRDCFSDACRAGGVVGSDARGNRTAFCAGGGAGFWVAVVEAEADGGRAGGREGSRERGKRWNGDGVLSWWLPGMRVMAVCQKRARTE